MERTRIGQWEWAPERRELRGRDQTIGLTELEASLLDYLVQREGLTVSHETLLKEVWQYADRVQSRAVTHTLARLRKKLGDDGQVLETVYGQGVRLELSDVGTLVGRSSLVREARRRLDAENWLALFGVGGVGKTSLAREVLRTRSCLWIRAEPLRTIEGLFRALGASLDLAQGPASRGVLGVALRRHPTDVLVLDGAENLPTDLVGYLDDWRSDAQVQVLITTRRLRGSIPGLLVPPLDAEAGRRLFRQRAATIQPRDSMPDPLVDRIVTMLDGLPLGLELAAGRLRVLSLEELSARLQRSIAMLGRGEQGLLAVMQGCWDGLSDQGQRVLSTLALFPDAVELQDLERVCPTDEPMLLDALEELVRAALVVERRPSFDLLDVVRRFARPKARKGTIERFVALAIRRARDAYDAVYSSPADGTRALADGHRRWSVALENTSDPVEIASLAISIRSHEVVFGGTRRMDELLATLDPAPLPAPLRIDLLNAQRARSLRPEDLPCAVERGREALAHARELDDPVRLVESWSGLLHVEALANDATTALSDAEALLDLVERTPLPDVVAGLVQVKIANVALRARAYERATAMLNRAVARLTARPDLQAVARRSLARTWLLLARADRAAAVSRVALDQTIERRDTRGQTLAALLLCDANLELGRRDAVRETATESLRCAVDIDYAYAVCSLEVIRAMLDDSLEALRRARERAEAAQLKVVAARASQAAGLRHHRVGDLDAARETYAQALSGLPADDPTSTVVRAWAALAEAETGTRPPMRGLELRKDEASLEGWVTRTALAALHGSERPPPLHAGPTPRTLSLTQELAGRLHHGA